MGDRFKVGDTIWCINPSYSYMRDRVGKYIPREITSITKLSYVVGTGYAEQKIKKSVAMDEAEAAREMWVEKNRYKIIRSAEKLQTYDELIALAKMTGWEEPHNEE